MSLQRVICGAKSPTRTDVRTGGGGGNVSRADWSTMPLSRQQGREVVSPFAGRATKDPHQAKVNNNTYPIIARSEPATHCDFYALAP